MDVAHKYYILSDSPLSRRLQTAYLITSLVLALGCCLLLIYLVWRNKLLRKPRHYLRCNLAADDIVFTVCLIPMQIHVVLNPDDDSLRKICWIELLVGSPSTVSMYGTYLMMATELYYFICQPLHYNTKVTTKRVITGILAVRAFALLFGAGPAVIKHLLGSGTGLCEPDVLASARTTAIFDSISHIGAGLAVIPIFAIYYLVFKEARVQQERDENRNLCLYQTKAFRTMAPHVVVLAVLSASIIFMATLAWPGLLQGEEKDAPLLIAAGVAQLVCLTLSSVVNPIVYSFLHPEFRRALRELCGMPQNIPAAHAQVKPPVQQGQDMEMAVFSTPDRRRQASSQEFTSTAPSLELVEGEGQREEDVPPSPVHTQGEAPQEEAPLSGQCGEEKAQPGRPMVLTVQAEVHPSPPLPASTPKPS